MTLLVAEPIAAYGARPPAVTDASFIAAIVYLEPVREELLGALAGMQPVAPDLLRDEIANVGMNKIRRKECSLDDALEGLFRFEEIAIDLLTVPLAPVLRLAERFSLSGYDASYLWLANELSAPLFTLDERLAEAARVLLQGDTR
ncbi:MAG: type II toxin-antitoxin system VapC family toxin [Rhodocyclaceae bacterium]